MEKSSYIPLGIVLSDKQVQYVKHIQSELSVSLSNEYSFEDVVYYLLMFEVEPEKLSADIRQFLENHDDFFLNVPGDIIKSSMYLEDYI